MSGEDSTSSYAPKSPDLSSFYSSPTQPAPQLHLPPSHSPSQYKVQPPSYTYGPSYASPMQPAVAAAPHHQHQHLNPEFSSYSPPSQQIYAQPNINPITLASSQDPYGLQPQQAFHQVHPSEVYPGHIPQQPASHHTQPYPHPTSTQPSSSAAQPYLDMPPRRAAAPPAPAPIIEPSPVKTKFPTARIKRIMQADEEVGKVAQQTPIAVGKALEMFMIQLVSKSAEVAKEKGSKRVTAPMLKQVVEMDDQWDFLRDIVSRVENEKEGAKAKAKTESDSDEDSEPRRKSRGRKKKMQ